MHKNGRSNDTPDNFGIMMNLRQSKTAAFLVNGFSNIFEWNVDDITRIDPNKATFELTSFSDKPNTQKLDTFVTNEYFADGGNKGSKWWIWLLLVLAAVGIAAGVAFYLKNQKEEDDDYDPEKGDGYYATEDKWNLSNSVDGKEGQTPTNPNDSNALASNL